MFLCMACGACCEWGRSKALAEPCRPGVSRRLSDQLARARRGLFPRSGATNRTTRLELVGPLVLDGEEDTEEIEETTV